MALLYSLPIVEIIAFKRVRKTVDLLRQYCVMKLNTIIPLFLYNFFKTKGHERNYFYTVEDKENICHGEKFPFPPTKGYDTIRQF